MLHARNPIFLRSRKARKRTFPCLPGSAGLPGRKRACRKTRRQLFPTLCKLSLFRRASPPAAGSFLIFLHVPLAYACVLDGEHCSNIRIFWGNGRDGGKKNERQSPAADQSEHHGHSGHRLRIDRRAQLPGELSGIPGQHRAGLLPHGRGNLLPADDKVYKTGQYFADNGPRQPAGQTSYRRSPASGGPGVRRNHQGISGHLPEKIWF